jgi:CRISPR-associated protein Csm1
VQIFLEGKFLGIEPFVLDERGDFPALAGRCLYVSLLSEAIPRALLTRLQLAPELLGSCGGGQFLAVIPDESLAEANAFLVEVTRHLSAVSGGRLRLAWAATENLGAWGVVRKRLNEAMTRWRGAAALDPGGLFEPFTPAVDSGYFRKLHQGLPGTSAAVWDPTVPGLLRHEGEAHWLATHFATAGERVATVEELAERARGRKVWGVVRGDVDEFAARMERAQTVEEYIQLSVFYRQFFAGEVQVLASRADFATRVSVLYTGGDEFAVCGAWDALIPFAREMAALFERTVEEYLKDFPGPEAKTLSAAIALSPGADADPASVFAEAGRQLEIAKSAGRDSIALLGRVLDWKQLTEAAELKDVMLRLVDDFGCAPQFLGELGAFYRETDRTLPARGSRRMVETQQRPWRLHRRLNRVLEGPERNKEFQKARNTLLAAFLTRGQGQLKLKASGRVALEWARTTEEAE